VSTYFPPNHEPSRIVALLHQAAGGFFFFPPRSPSSRFGSLFLLLIHPESYAPRVSSFCPFIYFLPFPLSYRQAAFWTDQFGYALACQHLFIFRGWPVGDGGGQPGEFGSFLTAVSVFHRSRLRPPFRNAWYRPPRDHWFLMRPPGAPKPLMLL